MFHYNILACGRETREGVRAPRPTAGAHNRQNGSRLSLTGNSNNGRVEVDNVPRRRSVNSAIGMQNVPAEEGSSGHKLGRVGLGTSQNKLSVSVKRKVYLVDGSSHKKSFTHCRDNLVRRSRLHLLLYNGFDTEIEASSTEESVQLHAVRVVGFFTYVIFHLCCLRNHIYFLELS